MQPLSYTNLLWYNHAMVISEAWVMRLPELMYSCILRLESCWRVQNSTVPTLSEHPMHTAGNVLLYEEHLL